MKAHHLCLAALLAGIASSAHASSGDAPLLDGCVELGAQQEVIRNGGSQAVLLRDGQAHYRVVLRGSCSSLSFTRSLSFMAEGEKGKLCPSGSRVRTDRDDCAVNRVELLEADEFAELKRRARR